MKTSVKLAGVLIALALGGCASDGPEFGDAVRNMAQGQQYDPSAPHEGNEGVDGQKAGRAIEAYRAPKQQPGSKATPAILMQPSS